MDGRTVRRAVSIAALIIAMLALLSGTVATWQSVTRPSTHALSDNSDRQRSTPTMATKTKAVPVPPLTIDVALSNVPAAIARMTSALSSAVDVSADRSATFLTALLSDVAPVSVDTLTSADASTLAGMVPAMISKSRAFAAIEPDDVKVYWYTFKGQDSPQTAVYRTLTDPATSKPFASFSAWIRYAFGLAPDDARGFDEWQNRLDRWARLGRIIVKGASKRASVASDKTDVAKWRDYSKRMLPKVASALTAGDVKAFLDTVLPMVLSVSANLTDMRSIVLDTTAAYNAAARAFTASLVDNAANAKPSGQDGSQGAAGSQDGQPSQGASQDGQGAEPMQAAA